MEVKVTPTKDIRILGLDERSLTNLLWCALSYRLDRLFWVDGYLLCLEVYEKAFEYEVKEGIFPISQVCYTKLPKYVKVYEVEKGAQIPIVDVSEMKLYREIVKAIKSANETV
ncbi:MAG: hypothetical protein ACE5Z5_07200 [Candidatus Bathyarchaeia archaeon]